MLSTIDQTRLRLSAQTDAGKKSQLGQFLTPARTARFMADMFPPSSIPLCRLLDPGAGIGSLSCAFIDRWQTGGFGFNSMEITACEIDTVLRVELEQVLASYNTSLPLTEEILSGDFVEEAVNRLLFQKAGNYTHAILNPPYKKINSHSCHRLLLRLVGIETVNLYSAFVALSIKMLAPGGHLVAIIPRSFCNGPYYRPFREFILKHAAIRHIHLFASRDKAFKDDGVLQENIIILLERDGRPGDVIISTSTDDSFADLATHTHPFDRIVFPDSPERLIHVPTSTDRGVIELSPSILHSLEDIGISVSTGPVVDFRLKAHLCDMPGPGTVPLLYPSHFMKRTTEWPKEGTKKPNAILHTADTEKWLFPNGFYCVVRRFSSKEEKRRIMASVVEPKSFPDAAMLGFENHLNVFHEHKRGLPEPLARGLAAFLNSTAVDDCFRRFSGHTQVNATDLKSMKYPSRAALIALGNWTMQHGELTQAMIDQQLEKLIV